MTDMTFEAAMPGDRAHSSEAAKKRLAARYAAERRFKYTGLGAIVVAGLALALLLTSVISTGWAAFYVKHADIEITLDPARIDPSGELFAADGSVKSVAEGEALRMEMRRANFTGVIRDALDARFPEVTTRREKRELHDLFSSSSNFVVADMVAADPSLIGGTITASLRFSAESTMYLKGQVDMTEPESRRRISDKEAAWLDSLVEDGVVATGFNMAFFQNGDSREPELAGIWGAMVGSFWTMLVTLLASLPLGVAAAIYLEEFARKTWMTNLIEVNINNLAAVPSIVFGLLGLAVFLNWFGVPRSAPLAGGLVLALMTLPTIIIASRAALKAVPPSIREAALGLGASRVQAVFHHVLPLAAPGIMTGSIIGMAQALGETAPLLMIGMVAFIVDIPNGITDPATVLPVQIFLWSDAPERAFVEKTGAAIMVLLGFLIVMNALAVVLRRRFERRW